MPTELSLLSALWVRTSGANAAPSWRREVIAEGELVRLAGVMARHRDREEVRSRTVLGLTRRVQVRDLSSATHEIVERAARRQGGYVCLCNVHVVVTALGDHGLERALDGAWRRLADGAPIAWLQRRMGHAGARRVGGPDLMPAVVDVGRSQGLRHFLLGSTPEIVAGVAAVLTRRYPGAEIVGSFSPPVSPDAAVSAAALDAIRRGDPHIVWCALGAPKQELWMYRASPLLPSHLLVGVGAAFDFLAGSKRRAPTWMQERGLEWVHRLGTEPRRLTGRYLRTNTEFVARCLAELLDELRAA